VARALFPEEDEEVLRYREEEGEAIEPFNYVPVLPLALVNGVCGIATGFATSVPCFSVASVVACCRAAAAGAELPELRPHYEGFVGELLLTERGVTTRGVFERRDARTVVVRELPVGRWTDPWLNELKEGGGDKAKFQVVGVVNQSSEVTVNVEVTFAEDVSAVEDERLTAFLKLSSNVAASFMYLHDASYSLRLFKTYHDIVRCHAEERLRLFDVRKAHQLEKLRRRIQVAEAKAAYIGFVVAGRVPFGRKKAELEHVLEELGLQRLGGSGGEAEEEPAAGGYGHLLGMQFASCTEENILKLRAEVAALWEALDELRAKSPARLWEEALVRFEEAYAAYLVQRRERRGDVEAPEGGGGGAKRKRGGAAVVGAAKKKAKA
jgi:DNA topoisomerase-2